MSLIKAVLGVIVALVLGIGGWVYSGLYDVAADAPHTRLVSLALTKLKHRSVAARAADIPVPPLDDRERVASGADHYDAMCKACHLAPGLSGTDVRKGLYPMPPSFPEAVAHGPAYNFWAVKHGIKLTGMPAWGETHDDQAIWSLVAFLEQLPGMSEAEYRALIEAAGGAGNRQGHGHDHGD